MWATPACIAELGAPSRRITDSADRLPLCSSVRDGDGRGRVQRHAIRRPHEHERRLPGSRCGRCRPPRRHRDHQRRRSDSPPAAAARAPVHTSPGGRGSAVDPGIDLDRAPRPSSGEFQPTGAATVVRVGDPAPAERNGIPGRRLGVLKAPAGIGRHASDRGQVTDKLTSPTQPPIMVPFTIHVRQLPTCCAIQAAISPHQDCAPVPATVDPEPVAIHC